MLTPAGVTVRRAVGSVLAVLALAANVVHAGEIALTFDDVPGGDGRRFTGAQRGARLIEELRKTGVEQAAFFVITGKVSDENRDLLDAYARAGHLLGNHSHRHERAADIGGEGFLADLRHSDRVLRPLPGFFPYFRFPYLNEGSDQATRQTLLQHLTDQGYGNAYVTVTTFDWYLDELFQRALAEGKTIEYPKLRRLYIDVIWQAVLFYDYLASERIGRSPRHVLVLHENDLAALFIADLVYHLRAQGWRIISPAAAYENPLAALAPVTLIADRRQVAAIAVREGQASQIPVFEDRDWLEEQFRGRAVSEN